MDFIKKIIKQENMTLTILLVVGIIGAINFISYQIFFRLDLTQHNDYSISQVSKKTVANLEDIVNIKLYFSKNLPPNFINLEREIKDILTEYKHYSNGKIKLEFIDPSSLDDPVKELGKIGIPALQFNVVKNDSYEVVNGFMAMSVQYLDKREVIPMIESGRNLEYRITTIIKKMVADTRKNVGLVGSHGSLAMDTMARQAKNALADLYQVTNIDLTSKELNLENIDTLILIGPRVGFEEEELRKIDQFIISGKSVLVLVDGIVIDENTQVVNNETGLNQLLEQYGLKLKHNLIADVSSGKASLPNGFFNLVVNYGFWPKIIKDNFSQENVMTASLESVILPWASEIEIIKDKMAEGVDATVLAASTDKACAYSGKINLDPKSAAVDCVDKKQYNFAVALAGSLPSAFGDQVSQDSRLIVVADSDFITDQFLAENSDNLAFFQNMVDGLTLDSDLISIRSAGVTDRPIKPISETAKEAIRYLNIFGITVVVLVLGISRYFWRRKSSLADEI